MFEKNGKWFADWFEADGHRRRKSFTSKSAAMRHEREMKAEKKAQRRGQSGKSSPRASVIVMPRTKGRSRAKR